MGLAVHPVGGGHTEQVPPPVICILWLLLDKRNISLCPGRQDWVEVDLPAGPARGRELMKGRSEAGGTAKSNTFRLGKTNHNCPAAEGVSVLPARVCAED